MPRDLVIGEDGLARCPWAASTPEYQAYHDNEWGLPVGDDNRVFEKLCLEGFQAGLSWLTILRKREAFRSAFASFDPRAVARFGDADIARLLGGRGDYPPSRQDRCHHRQRAGDSAPRRPRCSPRSCCVEVRAGAGPAPKTLGDLPASTPESKALSAELRRHGFRFVGPTTVYAAMQSLGLVNDHLKGCHSRQITASARASFDPPV